MDPVTPQTPATQPKDDKFPKLPTVPAKALDPDLVKDLFAAAKAFHETFEQKNGRAIVPANHVNQSKLVIFKDAAGRDVLFLVDHHNDRKALAELQTALTKISGKPADELLFIIEGYSSSSTSRSKFTPNYILGELGKKLDVKMAPAIVNIANPETIAEMLKRGPTLTPALTEKQILGNLARAFAPQLSAPIAFDLRTAVEDLLTTWNANPKDKKITVEEMYRNADKMIDSKGERIDQFVKIIDDHTKAKNVKMLDVTDRKVVEDLVTLAGASKPPFTREEALGMLICLRAPIEEKGLPNYTEFFKKVSEASKGKISFETLHNSLTAVLTDAAKQPEASAKVTTRVGELMHTVQDDLTAKAIADLMKTSDQVKTVVVIAGYLHEDGVRKGLSPAK